MSTPAVVSPAGQVRPRALARVGWLALAGMFGWLGGVAAHRAIQPTPVPAVKTTTRSSPDHPPPGGSAGASAPGWIINGSLDARTWHTLPAGTLRTAEAALWLSRATAPDIAAIWPALASARPEDWLLLDLLMDRWVRLDARGALAAVAGTPTEWKAWRAWGRANPMAAVGEAKARKSGFLWRALQGAGEGDPDTAKALLDEFPAFDYPAVRDAIKSGLHNRGWQESLEFAFERGVLTDWAKAEPDRALRWALDHADQMSAPAWLELLANLDDRGRTDLQGVLRKTPSGELKTNLLSALAGWTARDNPSAAFRMARDAPSPDLRNQLLAGLGMQLAGGENTAASLEALRLFITGGGILESNAGRVIRPDGESRSRSNDGVRTWLASLATSDPEGTLATLREACAAAPDATAESEEKLIQTVRGTWLERDLTGFSDFVQDLPAGVERDVCAGQVAEALITRSGSGQAAASSALAWAAEIQAPDRREVVLQTVIDKWLFYNQAACDAYFAPDGGATGAERSAYQTLRGGLP